MMMHATTKRLTTTASALSLGLMLCGSATAADTPAATLSTAPPAAATYPHWTPEERRQHWAQVQQRARELWAKVDLTPAERQKYWEQMQQSAREVWAQVDLTPAERQQYWEQIQQGARELWAKWGLTPEQRQQYMAQMQQGLHDLEAMMTPPAQTPPMAPAMAAVAVAVTPSATPAPTVASPPERVHSLWGLWRMTPEQRQQYWGYMQSGGK